MSVLVEGSGNGEPSVRAQRHTLNRALMAFERAEFCPDCRSQILSVQSEEDGNYAPFVHAHGNAINAVRCAR